MLFLKSKGLLAVSAFKVLGPLKAFFAVAVLYSAVSARGMRRGICLRQAKTVEVPVFYNVLYMLINIPLKINAHVLNCQ
jgi:hypothetical protein